MRFSDLTFGVHTSYNDTVDGYYYQVTLQGDNKVTGDYYYRAIDSLSGDELLADDSYNLVFKNSLSAFRGVVELIEYLVSDENNPKLPTGETRSSEFRLLVNNLVTKYLILKVEDDE